MRVLTYWELMSRVQFCFEYAAAFQKLLALIPKAFLEGLLWMALGRFLV